MVQRARSTIWVLSGTYECRGSGENSLRLSPGVLPIYTYAPRYMWGLCYLPTTDGKDYRGHEPSGVSRLPGRHHCLRKNSGRA
ncbi:hypothetical protein FKM82_007531 [Ascaphus truei]